MASREVNRAGKYFDRRRFDRSVMVRFNDQLIELTERLRDKLGLPLSGARSILIERGLLLLAKELGVDVPKPTAAEIKATNALARALERDV